MLKKYIYFIILFVFLISLSICHKCSATDLDKTVYYGVFDEQGTNDSSHVSYGKSEYKQNKYKQSKYDAISSNSHIWIILGVSMVIIGSISHIAVWFYFENEDDLRRFEYRLGILDDIDSDKITKEKIKSMDWFYSDEKTKQNYKKTY